MSMRERKGALIQDHPSLRRGARSWARTSITPLPAAIRKDGFELKLVRRIGRAAVYRQHFLRGIPDHDAYEVILPQVRNTNHEGETIEAYEGFPSAESWGTKGWTFTNLDKAVQKLLQLGKRASQNAPCSGTVSRRNRFDGQRRIRRGLLAKHARPAPVSEPFAPSFHRTSRTPMQRTQCLPSGSHSVPERQLDASDAGARRFGRPSS
jgi:hypothetical protein